MGRKNVICQNCIENCKQCVDAVIFHCPFYRRTKVGKERQMRVGKRLGPENHPVSILQTAQGGQNEGIA
jgi:hypothetical protein